MESHDVGITEYDGQTVYTIDGQIRPVFGTQVGTTVKFHVDTPGHPFHITTDPVGGDTRGVYDPGVSGHPTESGTVTVEVTEETPRTLYYNCATHEGMGNSINTRRRQPQQSARSAVSLERSRSRQPAGRSSGGFLSDVLPGALGGGSDPELLGPRGLGWVVTGSILASATVFYYKYRSGRLTPVA
jgi:hypothetical protein